MHVVFLSPIYSLLVDLELCVFVLQNVNSGLNLHLLSATYEFLSCSSNFALLILLMSTQGLGFYCNQPRCTIGAI